MGLPYWSLEGCLRGPGPTGPLYMASALLMSMGGLFGERFDGLRAVSGMRSSLPSLFSKEAKVGSLSAGTPPFAPLTIGMVGWAVGETIGSLLTLL